LNWATNDGSAKSGQDYLAAAGKLTFGVGETSKTFSINTLNDALYDPTRTFSVALTATANTLLGASSATVTVTDNDPLPVVNFTNPTSNVVEGGRVDLTVYLSNTYAAPVTVNWASVDGSANALFRDYVGASGTLIFAVGQTTKTISVNTLDDTLYDAPRSFSVMLSAPINATLGAPAVVNILDNDPLPILSITPVTTASVSEGGQIGLIVALNHSYAAPVTVVWTTADGTAKNPANYKLASGILTFAPGETSKTITVQTVRDRVYKPNLTFEVRLSKQANAYFSAAGTEKISLTVVNIDTP
jgi:hypothetical protein